MLQAGLLTLSAVETLFERYISVSCTVSYSTFHVYFMQLLVAKKKRFLIHMVLKLSWLYDLS